MTAQEASAYGEFVLQKVRYLVTTSGGSHTVNVYEVETGLMVCSVRDPLRAAEPQWAREWVGSPETWQNLMRQRTADIIRQWRAALDHGLAASRLRGGAL